MWRSKGRIVISLVVLILVATSCSVTRKRNTGNKDSSGSISDINAFADEVKALNINREGFIIRKAEVELEGTEIEGKFSLYAKVNGKGDFYISVRGPLGLELARAMSSGDSVFVVNKLNRVVLFGSRSSLLKRAGLPENLIEIVTGDLPDSITFAGAKAAENGSVNFSYTDLIYKSDISVDRQAKKISGETLRTSDGEEEYILKFGNFIDSGSKRFATGIEVEGVKKMFHVKMEILDMRLGFNDNIEIVLPGYRRESL